ncbi:MAG TPA: hypothetical protein VIN03_12000 [Roseateles sp.]
MMIYRAPGPELLDGVKCESRVIHDEDEMHAAAGDGWHPTPSAAGEALLAEKARREAEAADEERALAQAEAEMQAAAIRAPLEAEIEALKGKVADAEQALADERAAHAKTKAALAEPPAGKRAKA